jgi:hypothetical protein
MLMLIAVVTYTQVSGDRTNMDYIHLACGVRVGTEIGVTGLNHGVCDEAFEAVPHPASPVLQ